MFEVLAVALGTGAMSCGDDEPARDQTVFYMQLGTPSGATCSSARSFSLPDDTARTILTGSGSGDRLVDGSDDALVECSVTKGAGAGQFNVLFDLSRGEIGTFHATGPITMTSATEGTGTLNIVFQTSSFTLRQDGCTATLKAGLQGAVWVSALSCPNMTDASSPTIRCTGNGGFIAENCAR